MSGNRMKMGVVGIIVGLLVIGNSQAIDRVAIRADVVAMKDAPDALAQLNAYVVGKTEPERMATYIVAAGVFPKPIVYSNVDNWLLPAESKVIYKFNSSPEVRRVKYQMAYNQCVSNNVNITQAGIIHILISASAQLDDNGPLMYVIENYSYTPNSSRLSDIFAAISKVADYYDPKRETSTANAVADYTLMLKNIPLNETTKPALEKIKGELKKLTD